MSDAVVLRDAGVRYPTAAAPSLRDVTLRIAAGRSCLVLGPSGSGKSTLLRLLTGIVPQTVHASVTGDVLVLDVDPREVATADLARHVAYLQQNPLDQLCLATVLEDVAFTLENHGVPVDEIEDRARAALARVGAAHLAERGVATLSGGEAQRVALAGVLVAAPSLLLLDEPTAMLDPAAAAHVGAAVAGLLEGDGPTVLLIEHRLDELPVLPVDTLVIDASGALLTHAPTDEVLATHAEAIERLGCWLPLPVRGASPDVLAEPCLPGTRRTATAPAVGAPLLSARGVTVRVPGNGGSGAAPRPALVDDVDVDLHAGRLTAVLGVNGAGKSTLLRALAGLAPAEGTLTWPSAAASGATHDDSRRRRPWRRLAEPTSPRVGMVFQHPEHQFVRRTVREEIGHGAPDDNTARVDELLVAFGLDHVAETDPFRLSGGQQRRLSLASAFATPDPVLLVDEPTFAQDRRSAARIARELRAMADAGRAVVVVTHDLVLAAAIADDVLLMADGRVVARGTPADVLTPSTTAAHGLMLPELLRRRLAAGLSVEGWGPPDLVGTGAVAGTTPAVAAAGAHR